MKKPLKPSCNGLHRWRLLAFVTTTPGRTFTATPPEPLSAGDGSSLLLCRYLLFPFSVFIEHSFVAIILNRLAGVKRIEKDTGERFSCVNIKTYKLCEGELQKVSVPPNHKHP